MAASLHIGPDELERQKPARIFQLQAVIDQIRKEQEKSKG